MPSLGCFGLTLFVWIQAGGVSPDACALCTTQKWFAYHSWGTSGKPGPLFSLWDSQGVCVAPSLPEMPPRRGRQRPGSAAWLAVAEQAPSSPFPSYNAPTSSIVIQKGPLWSPGLPVPGTRACLLKAAWGKAAAFKPSCPSIHTASSGNSSFPGIPRGCVPAGEGSRETPSQDVAFPLPAGVLYEYSHMYIY